METEVFNVYRSSWCVNKINTCGLPSVREAAPHQTHRAQRSPGSTSLLLADWEAQLEKRQGGRFLSPLLESTWISHTLSSHTHTHTLLQGSEWQANSDLWPSQRKWESEENKKKKGSIWSTIYLFIAAVSLKLATFNLATPPFCSFANKT